MPRFWGLFKDNFKPNFVIFFHLQPKVLEVQNMTQ
jgi:hypothetical protein